LAPKLKKFGYVAQLGEQEQEKATLFPCERPEQERRAGFQAEQDCVAQEGAQTE